MDQAFSDSNLVMSNANTFSKARQPVAQHGGRLMPSLSTLTHPLIGIFLLVTDGKRLTRSSYLDSAKRLALATGAAKFASTVKEDCQGGVRF
jgi:hypothetical protein